MIALRHIYAYQVNDGKWDVRVALEAEGFATLGGGGAANRRHIVSDLRVLVAYQGRRRRAEEMLDQHLQRHRRRVTRVGELLLALHSWSILQESKRLLGRLYDR